ncbi:MAG: outer membrane lipoprotein carrier protein LolA [Bacteroidales bacterium]|jgi:outer membrane lipoprotein-sorting protein|nr:outer membrane lipoprotein carrier protein LolA [Bacteroidales bacterium]
MTIRKIRLIFVLSCLLPVTLLSQSAQTKKYQDSESTAILKELQKTMASYSTIRIEFTFRSEKNDRFIDEITGQTRIKGLKYTLKTDQQEVFCDGTTLWNYLPEQKEVTVSLYDKDDEASLMNPFHLIQHYEKYYQSDFIKEMPERGVLVQIIDLTPLKASSFYRIRLVLDKNKKQILRFIVYEKDGTHYTFTVTKFVVNQPLADSLFVFDASQHEGTEVIDIR